MGIAPLPSTPIAHRDERNTDASSRLMTLMATNAVILAAGRGRRLASMGWDDPKCLLEFGDRTLLERMLDALRAHGIRQVAIVVGYRRERVEACAARTGLDCTFVANEAFETTNTIHSLWLARARLGRDFLYFNADVLFDAAIVGRLLAGPDGALAVEAGTCGDEEVKVMVDDADRIIRIGKALPPRDCLGEFIGIARFAGSVASTLIDTLDRYNRNLERRDLFFEAALSDMAPRHALQAMRIGSGRAIEIDTPDDYRKAAELWDRGAFAAGP